MAAGALVSAVCNAEDGFEDEAGYHRVMAGLDIWRA
jgi:hypothetical protein